MIKYEVGNHERHWISKFALLDVLIPTPKEQQKIANTLSTLDNLGKSTYFVAVVKSSNIITGKLFLKIPLFSLV
jgi:restriction endonuclease S subunit